MRIPYMTADHKNCLLGTWQKPLESDLRYPYIAHHNPMSATTNSHFSTWTCFVPWKFFILRIPFPHNLLRGCKFQTFTGKFSELARPSTLLCFWTNRTRTIQKHTQTPCHQLGTCGFLIARVYLHQAQHTFSISAKFQFSDELLSFLQVCGPCSFPCREFSRHPCRYDAAFVALLANVPVSTGPPLLTWKYGRIYPESPPPKGFVCNHQRQIPLASRWPCLKMFRILNCPSVLLLMIFCD